MSNIDVEVTRYNEKVFLLSAGYRKHYLHFDNLNGSGVLMYFIIMGMNKVNIPWATDKDLWQDVIDFVNEQFGLKKDISFSSVVRKYLVQDRIERRALFYSGGKDSTFAHLLTRDAELLQFVSPVYKSVAFFPSEFCTSNVDNELFHSKVPSEYLKLEIMFPLIARHREVLMGVEKDSWDNHIPYNGFDIVKWQQILYKHGIIFDSPIKDYYSNFILEELHKLKQPFVKCNYAAISKRADKITDGKDFCYDCMRCIVNYAMGCNVEKHGFDREKFLALKIRPTGAKTFRDFLELRYKASAYGLKQKDMLIKIADEFGALNSEIPYE